MSVAPIESDAARICELEQRIGEAEKRIETDDKLLAAAREREAKLQAAIRDLFRERGWPDGGDLDGFAFQEWAERHGFLRAETRTSFCAKGCACSEYCNGNVGVLGNSGFICHRKVEWLAAPDSAAEQGEANEEGQK